MLALFLAANLMTGGVNMAVNTLEVGNWEARGVVGEQLLLVLGRQWVGSCWAACFGGAQPASLSHGQAIQVGGHAALAPTKSR